MIPNRPYSNSIFWVEVEKIHPNPYQPRREFDEGRLSELAESIRQYGVLQPLVVTRKEVTKSDGGIATEYELIAGERRLRASKLAQVTQVPVVIRDVENNDRIKLELAIIENLQREDLNPVDRARAFHRLSEEFGFKHNQIAGRVNRSREYVSNSLRILALPEPMLAALGEGKISEGHTRPLLMLSDRPEEQMTLFKEMLDRKITVRDAEKIARRIAYDRVRKKDRMTHPDLVEIEESLTERLGARVQIEHKEVGGRITISFTSDENLQHIIEVFDTVEAMERAGGPAMIAEHMMPDTPEEPQAPVEQAPEEGTPEWHTGTNEPHTPHEPNDVPLPAETEPQTPAAEPQEDLYNIKNFSI